MLVAAFFCLDRVPEDALRLAFDEVAVEVGELDAVEGEDGHFAVVEEDDVAGVMKNSGDVGGYEVFAFADADDDRWAEAGGDDLVRFERAEDAEGEGSGEALDGFSDCFFEGDGRSRCFGDHLNLLDQVGDDLGVGFGDEDVALGGELALELEVVFDDAVVDDDDASGAIAVGVGVLFGGAAVGGPAGVADAVGAVERVLAQDFFYVLELAGGAADIELFFPFTADGDAG